MMIDDKTKQFNMELLCFFNDFFNCSVGQTILERYEELKQFVEIKEGFDQIRKKLYNGFYNKLSDFVNDMIKVQKSLQKIYGVDSDFSLLIEAFFNDFNKFLDDKYIKSKNVTEGGIVELLEYIDGIISKLPNSVNDFVSYTEDKQINRKKSDNFNKIKQLTPDEIILIHEKIKNLNNDKDIKKIMNILNVYDQDTVFSGKSLFNVNDLHILTLNKLKKHFNIH